MLRHWQELHRAFSVRAHPAFQIRCPLGLPPDIAPPVGRLRRTFQKYVAYPWQTRLSGGAEVVHILDHSYAHLMRCTPAGACKIVTVHDLAPLEDPDALQPKQLRRFRRTVEWLNRADILLPVSEYTKKALLCFLTAAPRIEVLPMGVNVAGFSKPQSTKTASSLPQCPKILSIGSCLKRKNLALLPEVLRRVIAELGPVALVRVGEPLPPELRQRLDALLGEENLVELGLLADDEVVAIYQSTDVLLLPSRLEGFGLPVAEAMAAGCPVVCSRASSLPEVGGDAAMYFDPSDAEEAAAGIIEVLRNSDLRASIVDRGRRRAQELSWENHASRLAEIYTSVLRRESR
ncbi:MAG: glycosyltransferase family 1 protein [Chthoniobacteraceae bacterium]